MVALSTAVETRSLDGEGIAAQAIPHDTEKGGRPVAIDRCDHPKPYPTDQICPACELRNYHEENDVHASGPCTFCRAVELAETNSAPGGSAHHLQMSREEVLQVYAEAMLDDLLSIFATAGLDAVAVEMQIRRWHVYAPNMWEPPEGEQWEYGPWADRGEALRKMPYQEYLRTPEWAEQRRRAIERAEGRCQGCNADSHLEVHHRTYDNRGEEEAGDLTVLCAACHTAVHLVADGRRGKVRSQSRRPKR